MIVTLTGENDFLRSQALTQIVGSFIKEHGDMAVERFDGEESAAERMCESVSSLPFLSPRKLVILREPGKQKAFAENIAKTLKDVADSTDLVIIEPKLDKRQTYYKTLKKQTDFKEFGQLDANGLMRWASDYAKEQGGSLASGDARLLVNRLGGSQQLLKSELDKLLGYDPKITKQSIEQLTDPLPQSTIFDLLDAALSGQTQKANDLYSEQRALRVEPQAIVGLLAWQLHALAVVVEAGDRRPDEIAKAAKLNPFVVRKTLGLARGRSPAKVRQMIAGLLRLDIDLKTKSINADDALQLYLLKLAA